MTDKLNHFDDAGRAVMVDVSGKDETRRRATAAGYITMNAAAFAAVQSGRAAKGDVLGVARVAGIQATKRTAELIPLCHPLITDSVSVEFTLDAAARRVRVACTVQSTGKTGVEMEALTGASIALLTIYDMCKALDKSMEISGLCLLEKQGGKSGEYTRASKGPEL